MQPLWLYLHFPLLALELCYHSDGGGPAALGDAQGARLQLCNEAAQKLGLRPGMAVASACSHCPELQLYQPQPQQETEQLQALALWAGHFSARIAVHPPAGLLLEAASMMRYFGSLQALYQQLQQDLQGLHFSVQSGCGYTPGCARLLAVQGGGFDSDPERLRNRLLQLPVDALEIPARQRQQLSGMGIRQLRQLLRLPRAALRARFDDALLDYLDRLSGRQPDPPHYLEPPPRFEREMPLNHELDNSQALLFPLRRLLAELEGFLTRSQRLAEALQLQLQQRDGGSQQLTLHHRSGAYRAGSWLELWRLRLERLVLSQPVIGLRLRCLRLREMPAGNRDLFSPTGSDAPERLLGRLQTRLGHTALHGLALNDDHRPEQSWRTVAPGSAPPAAGAANGRPSWLLHSPHPLQQPPNKLQIKLLRGPERIASGWWDQQPVRRDYYLGRWPDGRLGWLFRDDQRRWYLHGWFG